MNLTTLGIDLAKTSFSLVGMDQQGKVVLRKTLKRTQLLPFIAQCPTSLIGMEACSGAHCWGREFAKLGHKVGIIANKFIVSAKPTPPFTNAKQQHNLWPSFQGG